MSFWIWDPSPSSPLRTAEAHAPCLTPWTYSLCWLWISNSSLSRVTFCWMTLALMSSMSQSVGHGRQSPSFWILQGEETIGIGEHLWLCFGKLSQNELPGERVGQEDINIESTHTWDNLLLQVHKVQTYHWMHLMVLFYIAETCSAPWNLSCCIYILKMSTTQRVEERPKVDN